MPATTSMIVIWVAVFVWQMQLDETSLASMQRGLGMRPAGILDGFDALIHGSGSQRARGAVSCILPLFTYQFLHGGPLHLLGNSLFFWVFGGRLEARAGAWRLVVFTLLCGALGAVTQTLASASTVPTIGASGAVAGTLAAYLIFYRQARILLLIPIVVVPVFVEVPVAMLVLAFCVLQLPPLQQLFSMGQGAPVAYLAHLGGLAAGILLAPLLRRSPSHQKKASCRPSNASGSRTC